MKPSILIIDDDDRLRKQLSTSFQSRGYDVFEASTLHEAEKVLTDEDPERIVLDLNLGQESGLGFIQKAKTLSPYVQIVILTGYGSISTAVAAIKDGAINYIPKPAHADAILSAFEKTDAIKDANHSYAQTPSLAKAEWEHIQRVLHDCKGNISETARRLRLHRRSLQRKLQKYAPKK